MCGGGEEVEVICSYLFVFHVQHVLEEVLSKVKENVCRYVYYCSVVISIPFHCNTHVSIPFHCNHPCFHSIPL